MSGPEIQAKVSVSTEGAEESFKRVGNAAEKMAGSVQAGADKAGKAVDGIGSGAGKSADEFNRAEGRISASIKRATQNLELLGKTASQKLEFRIAEQGLDAAKFEPALKKLREIEAQAVKAAAVSTASLNSMGASAAQTANALRMVPAQFTDIVTSLASGQAPLTVLIQQGGQLKDAFGGIGPAAKAIGGYIAGLVNPFTVSAAAAAGLGYALLALSEKKGVVLDLKDALGDASDATSSFGKAVNDFSVDSMVKEFNKADAQTRRNIVSLKEYQAELARTSFEELRRSAEKELAPLNDFTGMFGGKQQETIEKFFGAFKTNAQRDQWMQLQQEIKAGTVDLGKFVQAYGTLFAGGTKDARDFIKQFEKIGVEAERLALIESSLQKLRDAGADGVIPVGGNDPASEIKKEADAYATLIASIKAKTEENRLELAIGESTTESQKIRIKLDQDLAAGKIKLSEAHRLTIDAALADLSVSEQVIESNKRAAQGLKDIEKIWSDYAGAQKKSVESAIKEAERNEELARTFGLTKGQIEALELARLEEQLAQRSSIGMTIDEIEHLERLIDAKKRSATAMSSVDSQDAAKKAAEEARKEWERTVDKIDDVFRHGFADMLNNGKSTWKAFTKSLATTFKTTVADAIYKTFAQKYVVNMVGNFMGAIGLGGMSSAASAAQAVGGGGTNYMSLLSAGKTLWEGFSTGIGATTGGWIAAAGNALGSSAVSAFGAGWGMTSAQAAQAAAAYNSAGMGSVANSISYGNMAGTAAGWAGGVAGGIYGGRAISGGYSAIGGQSGNTAVNVGTAVGAFFGPIGALVGGLIGGVVNRAFGRGPKKVTGFGIDGDFDADGFSGRSYSEWKQKGGWFRSDKKGVNYSALDESVIDQFSNGMAMIKASTADMVKSLGLSASALDGYSKHIRLALTSSQEENNKRIEQMFNVMGDELASLVYNFSSVAKEGETASVTLLRLANSITTVNSWLKLFDYGLLQASVSGGDAASKLADLFGGLEGLNKASAAFYNTYYSESERVAQRAEDMKKVFSSINLAMPETMAQFRSMAGSLDLTTDAGRRTYAALMSIAPEFASINESLDKLAKETAGKLLAAFSVRGDLLPALSGANLASAALNDEIHLLRVNAAEAAIDFAGLSNALASANIETFVETIAQIFANLTDRISGVIGSILDERGAVRESAQQIINPTVMSKTAIQQSIAGINTALPSNAGVVSAQSALTSASKDYDMQSWLKDWRVRIQNGYQDQVTAYQAEIDNLASKGQSTYGYELNLKAALSNLSTAQSDVAIQNEKAIASKATLDAAAAVAKQAQLEYAKSLQNFAIDAGKSIVTLSRLREETVRYYEEQKRLADLMANSAAGLRNSVKDYRYTQLTPEEQLTALRSQYSSAYSMALSTDGEVLSGYADKLNGLINPLLEKAKEVYGEGADYNTLVSAVFGSAQSIASRLESLTPTDYAADSLELLEQIDATLVALESSSRSAEQLIVSAIDASRDQTVGGLRAVVAALTGQSIPAFATGGLHSGGLRIVGENGPELEATGPARIFNSTQTRAILSGGGNAELIAEVRALRMENTNMRMELQAIATHTNKTARQLDRIERDGMTVKTEADSPLMTEVAA